MGKYESKADLQRKYDKLVQQWKMLVVNEAHYKRMWEDTQENYEKLLYSGNVDNSKLVLKK